ncbi:MAG TPA: hybrid sensor histidine kinase/response regulator [Cyanobacteria bacterium UBA8553]|nr:hybrid sensor histidine kinase/response regulator [Cyanobacteria bacterium UBA8553]HAJ60555.1 hybrid sensor histidine kinase/response regulator [Cyanobacteria bacterium UBA8543]
MSNDLIKVLLVEDDIGDADLICELLELIDSTHFQVTQKKRLKDALQYLSQESCDVVLLDLSLPDSHGLGTVCQVYTQVPTVPIVILSGLEDESLAIEALQKGAQDYLVKGQVDSNLLVRAIRYAIERTKIRQLLNQKEKQLQTANENLERRVEERTTDLKQANEQLQILEAQLREALAQEKELSELKSRIITTVSHEYRTPLTTIASSAEMLQIYRHKWDEDKQVKHFQRIQSAVQHMVALVNDVLFLNKAEFEKQEFQPTLINLIPFFQEVIDELQSPEQNKYHIIFTHQNDGSKFYLDTILLRQILTNLLSNAIKYSPKGGRIQVKLTCEENQVIFQVQDEGIGIPKEDQLKLFKSFSRASNVGAIAGTGHRNCLIFTTSIHHQHFVRQRIEDTQLT